MRFALATLSLALAACAKPLPPEAPAYSAPFTGEYTAISTTAMSLTGDLNVSADVLSFARGFRIEGPRVAADLTGDTDLSAGGGALSGGSGVAVTEAELRRIDLVRVAADARAPDLCGGASPSFVILGRGGDTLSVQVFSGAEAPGPNAHDTQLCGIFNYAAN